jgi:hypothetical protein
VPAYDEQIIARPGTRVQPQDFLWFPAGAATDGKRPKKEPPFPAAFEVDNREASNRVTGATRCPNEDDLSYN